MAKFEQRLETHEEKIYRLLGQYPHNTWCPTCLIRMVDYSKADLIEDTVYCSTSCAKESRLNNLSKLRRTKS